MRHLRLSVRTSRSWAAPVDDLPPVFMSKNSPIFCVCTWLRKVGPYRCPIHLGLGLEPVFLPVPPQFLQTGCPVVCFGWGKRG